MRMKYSAMAAMIAGVTSAAAVLPAVAQEKNSLALEEVIVTARKRAESLQEIPVSVTALGEQLQRSTIQSIQDVQGYVPNVNIERIATNNGASISIRGISFQDPDKSMDSPVGVILDGVYMGTIAGGILSNFDMERIEVLRGPQGTLFGKNTTAGALNIIRTAPTKEFGGKVRVGVGSWDKTQLQAVINTPLGESGGLKLFGNKEDHDGYIQNDVADTDVGVVDYQQLGATIAFDVTEDFDISFTAERIEDNSDAGAFTNLNDANDLTCLVSLGGVNIPGVTKVPGDASGAPIGSGCGELGLDTNSDEDHSSQNEPNSSTVTNDFYNLAMNWDLDDNWTVTSITGYIDREEEFRLEYDASPVEMLDIEGYQDYSQFTQELRINGDLTDSIKLTAGLYYFESEYEQFQESFDMWYYIPVDVAPTIGLPDPLFLNIFGTDGGLAFGQAFAPGDVSAQLGSTGENTSYAAFASMDWQLSDSLLLNLGGRITQEERTLESRTPNNIDNSTGTILTPYGPLQQYKDDWTEFSPRVALQYTLNDDMMVYGSFSSGFKSGGFFARTQDVNDITSFDPEYVDTYEIGYKSEWLENRLRFNATAFYSDYKDKQEEDVVDQGGGNVTTIVYNAADATISGLELEFAAQITEGLSAFLNVGLLDAEFDEFNSVDSTTGLTVDVSDREIRNAPDTTVGVGIDYILPISIGEFGFHYNYQWRDEYHSVLNNDARGLVDAGGFHNASVDLSFNDSYKMSLYGRNLGNERYVRAIPIGISTFGQYNAPEHYGFEFTVEF